MPGDSRRRRVATAVLVTTIGCAALALTPAYGSLLESMLIGWIGDFRAGAIERGVEEIPSDIREALSEFVPDEVLADVRWRVDGKSTIAGLGIFRLGSAYALTLDDVILFASTEEAADVGIWAHELCHVMQFRKWGIAGFVESYVADHLAVEREAKDFRFEWELATGRLRIEPELVR